MRPSALVFIIVVVLLFNRSPWVDAANGHDLIISNLSDFGCFQMNVRPILERFSQLASSAKLFQDGHAHGSFVWVTRSNSPHARFGGVIVRKNLFLFMLFSGQRLIAIILVQLKRGLPHRRSILWFVCKYDVPGQKILCPAFYSQSPPLYAART